MTGMELAGLVGMAALGLAGMVLLVWAAVEECRDARVDRRRAEQHTRRLPVQDEQARIHQDAQVVSRRLQQQAWAVRRQMVQQVIGQQTWPQAQQPHQRPHPPHPVPHHLSGGGGRG